MRTRRSAIAIIAVAAAIIVTAASVIFIRQIPKSKSTSSLPPKLNLMLTNEMSEVQELAGLDRKMKNYLRKWFIKGGSLAIMRNDSLVYAKGYGWADEE